ncbi:hypothetical protein [Hyphococcus sp.]|uniref:hypothetical protein n=1 Tax=Hyphococcus sp. TaxID=2038636 RepID=UPI003CCBB0F4
MTSVHAIIVVMIRLWSASAIINSLMLAPVYVEMTLSGTPDRSIIFQLAAFGVWLILGVIAWFTAPWLSRRVLSNSKKPDLNLNIDAQTLIAIGSFLIGIAYLAMHLPPILIDWASWLIQRAGESPTQESHFGTSQRNIIHWNSFISNFSIVIVASAMAFRPSYLARIFNWLRSAGHQKESEVQS